MEGKEPVGGSVAEDAEENTGRAEEVIEATYGEVPEDEYSTFLPQPEYAHVVDGGEGEIAVAAADIGSYGDYLIEEFSVEANVHKVSKYTKMPQKVAAYMMAVVYLAVGVLCAVIPSRIEHSLPYIVGGALCLMSVVQFVFAIVRKEYKSTESNKTASSLIMLGLSVMIIIEHDWAHTFIPIVWGVLGLFEAAHAFNHALSRISRGMRSAYYIIKGIIELAVAFLLLYKPEQYGELHIIVFGVSLIIDGITTVPVIKKFVAKR